MATLPKQITDKFLQQLSESEGVTSEQIDALKKLMEKDSKLKANEVAAVLSPAEDDSL